MAEFDKAIIACYFTGCKDDQRGAFKLPDDHGYISEWYNSVINIELTPVILYDYLSNEFISEYPKARFFRMKVNPGYQLYDFRWLSYGRYLFHEKSIKNAFFTDISDVIVKKNPFIQPEYNENTLFIGDELLTLQSWPMLHVQPEIKELVGYENIIDRRTLLNGGIIGGSRNIMLKYFHYMRDVIRNVKHRNSNTTVDIPLYNYVAYKHFDNIVHGPPVNSIFTKYEYHRNDVWFVHK